MEVKTRSEVTMPSPESWNWKMEFWNGIGGQKTNWRSHYRPFPMHEQNQLDIVCDSGILLQLVFSLTFELELTAGQRSTASAGLVVLQILSIITPFVIPGMKI